MDGFSQSSRATVLKYWNGSMKRIITDEWRYIWKHDPHEPVYEVMMGGFVESLNLAFVYEQYIPDPSMNRSGQSGFDYQPLLWRTHILTDCPDDDANYEKDENAGTGVAAKRLSKFTLFPRLWR